MVARAERLTGQNIHDVILGVTKDKVKHRICIITKVVSRWFVYILRKSKLCEHIRNYTAAAIWIKSTLSKIWQVKVTAHNYRVIDINREQKFKAIRQFNRGLDSGEISVITGLAINDYKSTFEVRINNITGDNFEMIKTIRNMNRYTVEYIIINDETHAAAPTSGSVLSINAVVTAIYQQPISHGVVQPGLSHCNDGRFAV